MIVVMEETATDAQVSKVIEMIVELGFDIYRTTGARYTILGAVGARPIEQSDVQAMEKLDGVKDVVRISGESVEKIKRPVEPRAPANPDIRFNHITIFGVGLIGGSFALAAKEAGLSERITGCGDKKFLEAALSYKVIDGVDEAFEKAETSDADLIYLAAPVGAILDFLREKGSLIKAGAIVTDAGSAKREICNVARQALPAKVHFVGGHPMAGSHKVGVEFANAELFKRAPYAVVVEDATHASSPAVHKIISVVEAIGGRVVTLTAAEHDEISARISHAPQLISSAIANAVAKSKNEKMLALAGTGFGDMTRLARSSWSVWEDIVKANRDEIAAALAEVILELQAARDSIATEDFTELQKAFKTANDFLLEAP
jgi:prephenate dehydrogenase